MEEYGPDYFEVTHRNYFDHPNVGLFRWILDRLPPNVQSIVDIGCGRGDFLRELHRLRPRLRLVGIDFSPNRADEGIEYLQGDAMTLPLERRFDAVVTLQAIEHVPDPRGFLDRMISLCHPGGTLVVSTINEAGLPFRVSRLARRLGLPIAFERLYDVHHLHHFSVRSLVTLCKKAGLVVETVHLHDRPLASVDVPPAGLLTTMALRYSVLVMFLLGHVIYGGGQQTIIARVP